MHVPRDTISRIPLPPNDTVVVQGELLPAVDEVDADREQWVKLLSLWTDNLFEIPGLGWRFGLDPIVGLFPVVGDLASTMVSLYIVAVAVRLRVPPITLARMLLNIGIDYGVGAIPFVGNVFDFMWKANDRNFRLLERSLATPIGSRRRQTFWDWLFVGGMAAAILALFVGSLVAAIFIVKWFANAVGASS
jgi:hypothetical protein